MFELTGTNHAQQRMRQRGFSETDLALIMTFGTEMPSGFLLRKKDVIQMEHRFKKVISRLRRLIGTCVVSDGDTVITVFRAKPTEQHRRIYSKGSQRRGKGQIAKEMAL